LISAIDVPRGEILTRIFSGRTRPQLELDLVAQWKGLESEGQFRFTPPTHALLAFGQALQELEAEVKRLVAAIHGTLTEMHSG
jgi:aspartate aminotransferase-like enzyme